MIEIVINACVKGQAILSAAGLAEYNRRTGKSVTDQTTIARDDATLVAMMKQDISAYRGYCAQIRIVELPDGFKWKLMTGHGNAEWIAADV